MTDDPITTSRTRRARKSGSHLSTGYVAAWLLLGAVATAYLAVLAARPDMLVASARPPAAFVPASQATSLAAIQRSLAGLEDDVNRLKSSAQVQDQREKALVERVSVIENRISGMAVSALAPAPTTAATTPAAPATTASALDPRRPLRIIASAPTPPEAKAADAKRSGRDAAKLDGRLEAPAAVALPAPVPVSTIQTGTLPEPVAAGRPMGIRLASLPSVAALRLNWDLLTERHQTALKSLQPRYSGSDTTSYQLVAGPLPNAAEAQKLCQSLKARGVSCTPAEFTGEGL